MENSDHGHAKKTTKALFVVIPANQGDRTYLQQKRGISKPIIDFLLDVLAAVVE